jgi:crotonobetainyl-CoA:carnitine CoA-transferase CaiB-like acyl-CoA transferase
MGLAPDSLREVNPGLVAVRISGYGQDGPYRDKAVRRVRWPRGRDGRDR